MSRLVVYGNRDNEKYEVRKYSMAAEMMVTRLVIALVIIMGFEIGVADIKGLSWIAVPLTDKHT